MRAVFVAPDGREVAIEVPVGTSLMRAAVAAGIPGIVADCGGLASCATCHVFVDPGFADRLPEPGPNENQMLDCTAAERRSNSRLSCQITMSEDLDGIRVTVADPQL